jgi:predicted nicotinamide N-methyase
VPPPSGPGELRTSAGDVALEEYRVALAGREWTVLHTGAVLSHDDEQRYLSDASPRLPYGVALWPAAIALAHDVAARPDAFRGRSVLELGAGTGLPGIVAAACGARVLQTDRQELALTVCRGNGARNGVDGLACRAADWMHWDDPATYDWVIGSDILYSESMHPHLRRVFDAALAPGGRLLLADPFRAPSLRLLETMEAEGWTVAMSKWTVGEASDPRAVGVFELAPPAG